MSNAFLANFMRFAQAKTRADRCMAFDMDLNIQDRMNIDDTILNDADFADLLQSAVDQALNSGDVVITNNLITDPEDAPKTNVHLHQLRIVVTIPLRGVGAIYLDQRIRNGVIQRDLVEKLNEFGQYLIENEKIDLDPGDFGELFDS